MWIFVALKATLVSYKWLFQQLSLYISDNTSRSIGKIKKNKVDFKGHLERNAKPISNQNLFSRFQSGSWTVAQKMKSRDQAVLGIFIWKNQAIWLAKRILGSKLKNQNVKLLEMTIFFFFRCLPTCKKSALYLKSLLTYCKFNNRNYFLHAQVCLATPISLNWIKKMYLWMLNHIQPQLS